MCPSLKIRAWVQTGHTHFMTVHIEPPCKNFRNHPWFTPFQRQARADTKIKSKFKLNLYLNNFQFSYELKVNYAFMKNDRFQVSIFITFNSNCQQYCPSFFWGSNNYLN